MPPHTESPAALSDSGGQGPDSEPAQGPSENSSDSAGALSKCAEETAGQLMSASKVGEGDEALEKGSSSGEANCDTCTPDAPADDKLDSLAPGVQVDAGQDRENNPSPGCTNAEPVGKSSPEQSDSAGEAHVADEGLPNGRSASEAEPQPPCCSPDLLASLPDVTPMSEDVIAPAHTKAPQPGDADNDDRPAASAPAKASCSSPTSSSSGSSSSDSSSSDSSSSESSSESSSDSSDDDDDRERQRIRRALALAEREEESGPNDPLRTKHEADMDKVRVEPVSIEVTDAHNLVSFGRIKSIMPRTVVVESLPGALAPQGWAAANPYAGKQDSVAEARALDADTVVCLAASRKPFGRVFETFGPVTSPFYILRFNADAEIEAFGDDASIGKEVAFIAGLTHLVRAGDILTRGYDSSNLHDEEVSGAQEFSDDEAESMAKRARKRPGGRDRSSDAVPNEVGGMRAPKRQFQPMEPRGRGRGRHLRGHHSGGAPAYAHRRIMGASPVPRGGAVSAGRGELRPVGGGPNGPGNPHFVPQPIFHNGVPAPSIHPMIAQQQRQHHGMRQGLPTAGVVPSQLLRSDPAGPLGTNMPGAYGMPHLRWTQQLGQQQQLAQHQQYTQQQQQLAQQQQFSQQHPFAQQQQFVPQHLAQQPHLVQQQQVHDLQFNLQSQQAHQSTLPFAVPRQNSQTIGTSVPMGPHFGQQGGPFASPGVHAAPNLNGLQDPGQVSGGSGVPSPYAYPALQTQMASTSHGVVHPPGHPNDANSWEGRTRGQGSD